MIWYCVNAACCFSRLRVATLTNGMSNKPTNAHCQGSFSKPAANECPMPRWACSVLMMVAYGAASSARASSSVRTTSRSSSNASAYRSRVVSATVEFPRGAVRLSLPKRRANPAPSRTAPTLGLDAVNGRVLWLRQGLRCALWRPRPEFFAPLLFLPVWLSRSPGGSYCQWAARLVRAGGQYPKL